MKLKALAMFCLLTCGTHLSAYTTNTASSAKVEQLLNAIESNNVQRLDSLIRYGIDPNLNTSIYNTTPLLYAVELSSYEVVKSLVQHGANVDIADNFGTTPLMSAIKANKPTMALLLMQYTKQINKKDNNGSSALHYAAKTGNEMLFRKILQVGGNLRDLDRSGNNALFYAIAGRNKQIINKLIDMQYFNLAHQNKSGENAYKVAQRYQLPDIAARVSRGRN